MQMIIEKSVLSIELLKNQKSVSNFISMKVELKTEFSIQLKGRWRVQDQTQLRQLRSRHDTATSTASCFGGCAVIVLDPEPQTEYSNYEPYEHLQTLRTLMNSHSNGFIYKC